MSEYLTIEQRTDLVGWFGKKLLEHKLDEIPRNMVNFALAINEGEFKHVPLERRAIYATAAADMAESVRQLLIKQDVKVVALPNDGFETEVLKQFWPMYDDGTVGNLLSGTEFLMAMLGLTYNVYMEDRRYRDTPITTPVKQN
ncbi:MAG: hypothetical protein NTX24_04160 [Candidatus Pacearchaeota archaeon]|nr:hypothetical protein [Candidatus Pacearchaeota archaeon]